MASSLSASSSCTIAGNGSSSSLSFLRSSVPYQMCDSLRSSSFPTLARCSMHMPCSVRASGAEAPPLALPKQKIQIKLRSFWVPQIEEATRMIVKAALSTETKIMGPVPIPTKRRVYSVSSFPHANKGSREHFEIRTHQRLIELENTNADTIDSLMQLDIPSGVDVEVKLS